MGSLDRLFAANLLKFRTQRKMTQAKVAEKTELSVSYISMLERGQRSPPLHTLYLLSRVFGVKPGKFLE